MNKRICRIMAVLTALLIVMIPFSVFADDGMTEEESGNTPEAAVVTNESPNDAPVQTEAAPVETAQVETVLTENAPDPTPESESETPVEETPEQNDQDDDTDDTPLVDDENDVDTETITSEDDSIEDDSIETDDIDSSDPVFEKLESRIKSWNSKGILNISDLKIPESEEFTVSSIVNDYIDKEFFVETENGYIVSIYIDGPYEEKAEDFTNVAAEAASDLPGIITASSEEPVVSEISENEVKVERCKAFDKEAPIEGEADQPTSIVFATLSLGLTGLLKILHLLI